MNAAITPCTQGTKRKLTSNHIDFDRLCRLLKVDTWDEIDDRVHEWGCWDANATEEENLKNEAEERDEYFRKYYDAVMHVAEDLFEKHGLRFEGVRFRRRKLADRPWDFRILPIDSWLDAASHLRQTIDGMGPFTFSSVRYFLSTGPYTAREAVLRHLGWIPDWYEVYEGGKAASRVDRRLR